MKKLLTIIFLLSIIVINANSQSQFTVQTTSGNSTFYSNFKAAVANSSNGDIIYVPAGNFNIDGIQISKGIHIIGVGHNPDSTGSTGASYFTGNLYFIIGADNGSIQGISLMGNITFGTNDSTNKVNNFVISRCYILGSIFLAQLWNSTANGSNFQISECILEGGICCCRASNLVIKNNILFQTTAQYGLFVLLENAIVNNNIIYSTGTTTIYGSTGTTFKNNVILKGVLSGLGGYTNNILLNNLYADTNGLQTSGVAQNIGNVWLAKDKILVSQKGTTYNYKDNYALSTEALNAISGTDGTQVGIYGTATPFKVGALPPNPHIQYMKVEPVTRSDSKLNIDFKVQAQTK